MKEKTIAKQTPGPWTYEVTNGSNLAVMAGDEYVVSGCGCCGSPNCEEADARLIAAAPDLLEELENCLDLLATCFFEAPIDSCMGVAITKARAAIAKATGSTG